MFAKVFTQILDSSLANDYQVRHVFEDLLKLADVDGVVDSTIESISRRTNVPVDIVERAIRELEKPDPSSRTPDHEGKRLLRIDEHRDWGWFIANYDYYRSLASEEQRRERTRERVKKYRKKPLRNACNAPVTPCNAGNTSVLNSNDSPSTSTYSSTSPSASPNGSDMALFLTLKKDLSELYKRTKVRLTCEEEQYLLEVSKRPEVVSEFEELKQYKPTTEYFPRSMCSLLRDWDKTLDQSRNQPVSIKHKTLIDKELDSL